MFSYVINTMFTPFTCEMTVGILNEKAIRSQIPCEKKTAEQITLIERGRKEGRSRSFGKVSSLREKERVVFVLSYEAAYFFGE